MIKQNIKRFLKGLAIMGMATVVSNAVDLVTELPIPVLEDVELPSGSFFISSGLPLSEGLVQHVDELIIQDAEGRTVPTRYSPLAYWPDGSVKWVGLSPVLSSDVVFPVSLYRQSGGAPVRESALEVSRKDETVTIENGLIKVSVNGGDWTLENLQSGEKNHVYLEIDRISRVAQKVRSGWLAEKEQVAGKPVQTYSSAGKAASIEIEESGPVRAVVRVKGVFCQAGAEDAFNRYDYRLYVYADVPTVRWQATWIFDGDPAVDSIGRLEAIVHSPSISGAGAVAGVFDAESARLEIPVEHYIVQDTVDEVRIGDEIQAGRLAGWITLNELNGSVVNVAVKDFWQHYPSGFELDNHALKIGLWPGSSGFILDLARSSDGTGEGEHGPDLNMDATGIGKTFDLLFDPASSSQDFVRIAALFDLEPLFYPGNDYMTDTWVLGDLAYEDYESFPRLEGFYKAAVHWLMENRQRFNWYGFIDYGDVRTDFLTNTREWKTQGRYGWRHGSGDVPQGIMIQYFRTGDPVAWNLGAPYARHVMDLDTVHYARASGDQPVGAMHRRGQDHWSGSVQSQYTYTQGAFLYHYLSGDLRVRSVLLEEVAAWQSEPDQAWSANAANTVVRAWEATGDPHWLEAAERQMDGHLNETTYDNFRFASDYVPALVQYTRLTGDERGLETIAKRAEMLLDAENWAYFHPGIDRRGGRMMLLGEMYRETGDAVKFIDYPTRLIALVLPPLPPDEEKWNFDTLTDYMGAAGLSATTQISEIGRGPYYLSALQEAGWTEQDILTQPALHGTRAGLRLSGTYADVGQPQKQYDNQWKYIDLPMLKNCEDAARRVAERIKGLPAGGVLDVNNIPFKMAPGQTHAEGGVLFLCDEGEVEIPVPPQAEALYLLGPMIEKGDWREGVEVIEYTLHLRNGETRQGVWRHLSDLNDYRGFHYSRSAIPGRFWHLGAQNRVHAYVIQLDFDGEDVASVTLRDSGNGYNSFILAATAKLKQTDDQNFLQRIVFSETTTATDSRIAVFSADTPTASDEKPMGWLLSEAVIDGLQFSGEGVTTDENIGLQIPLENGDYLVSLKVSAGNLLGGVLQIGVSGNGFGVVAVSGMIGDRIQVPARVKDGLLKVWINSVPALHSTPNQRAKWHLESVEVHPLPEGEWHFQPELEMSVIEGEPLAAYAEFDQSVGATHDYSFRNMEQMLAGGSMYQVDGTRYPQDIIFRFKEPVEITGVLFSPAENNGPKNLVLQVRHPGDDRWHTIKEWALEARSLGILESIPGQEIVAARLLMNEGYSRNLWVIRADIFGIK